MKDSIADGLGLIFGSLGDFLLNFEGGKFLLRESDSTVNLGETKVIISY